MGMNVDLTHMLNLPTELPCPRCHEKVDTTFDDYDIECGKPNPSPGNWELRVWCEHCDFEWKYRFSVTRESFKG
jgi:hypothetical protein